MASWRKKKNIKILTPAPHELGMWRHTPVIPALKREKQEVPKLKVILNYIASSRQPWAT